MGEDSNKMILTKANLRIEKHDENDYRLHLLMPGHTGNYLNGVLKMSVNDALIARDLLLDQELYSQDVTLFEEEKYFRIAVGVKDVNGDQYFFHSRKLNLNDAVYERDELIS